MPRRPDELPSGSIRRTRVKSPARDLDAEGTSSARFAVDTDAATHRLRKTFADGEPESRPAKSTAGRTVGLLEGLKDVLQLLYGHTNARVIHAKLQQRNVGTVGPIHR